MTTKPTRTPATDPDSPIEHDVAVVGGGASGLAAAVFVARYGLDTTVFDGGKAAITQCAHVENYLGFPGGISPNRFLDLGRAHATHEGVEVVDDRVTAVRPHENEGAFLVETAERECLAERVVVAAAYDETVLAPVAEALDESEDVEADADDLFVPTDDGRTAVDGLYVAGWMSDETAHQVGINAGHGSRVGLTLARDHMSERYWPAVGERYVDWVVHDGRYGGEGWDEHVDEWFDREMLPADHDLDSEAIAAAREDLKAEFLGRCLDEDERRQRDRAGQRELLEHVDDDLIREHVTELEGTDTTHAN
ncbi:FAD-dependent oxidoreductase (plasmid) [Halobaculum sp. CBA1158]|uniref:FAD-dependent oxidoreductase n=1 Tax=Halobaculum sp. CBA1158 TaxID=2904243 RepID=UPI001F467DB1|nr:FAD-dependent oxidoreductase [Halobaculum sp. CBA1158]UIP01367.1 FAD-dependent oxidoreductase [Halobaculum sp. CBA1158]